MSRSFSNIDPEQSGLNNEIGQPGPEQGGQNNGIQQDKKIININAADPNPQQQNEPEQNEPEQNDDKLIDDFINNLSDEDLDELSQQAAQEKEQKDQPEEEQLNDMLKELPDELDEADELPEIDEPDPNEQVRQDYFDALVGNIAHSTALWQSDAFKNADQHGEMPGTVGDLADKAGKAGFLFDEDGNQIRSHQVDGREIDPVYLHYGDKTYTLRTNPRENELIDPESTTPQLKEAANAPDGSPLPDFSPDPAAIPRKPEKPELNGIEKFFNALARIFTFGLRGLPSMNKYDREMEAYENYTNQLRESCETEQAELERSNEAAAMRKAQREERQRIKAAQPKRSRKDRSTWPTYSPSSSSATGRCRTTITRCRSRSTADR